MRGMEVRMPMSFVNSVKEMAGPNVYIASRHAGRRAREAGQGIASATGEVIRG